MNVTLYGLLYLAENQSSAINVNVETFAQQRSLYTKNAINLSLSLQKSGIRFILLTNKKEELCDELKSLDCSNSLNVEYIDFKTKVLNGIKFYAAHFKFDVFSYLAALKNEQYVGLIDLDMIALGEMPECLKNIIQEKIPICYDISDQVIPAYGHNVIIRDMQKLSPNIFEGRWSGGEFIMGTPDFFASLDFEIRKTYERYIEVAEGLHHQGDEMLTSVALEKLRRNGKYIADAGTIGIVGRFWSMPTLHEQKSFRYFENCFLLHLPSDKKFLAELTPKQVLSRNIFLEKIQSIFIKKECKNTLNKHS